LSVMPDTAGLLIRPEMGYNGLHRTSRINCCLGNGVLSGGDILPGSTLAIKDIFPAEAE